MLTAQTDGVNRTTTPLPPQLISVTRASALMKSPVEFRGGSGLLLHGSLILCSPFFLSSSCSFILQPPTEELTVPHSTLLFLPPLCLRLPILLLLLPSLLHLIFLLPSLPLLLCPTPPSLLVLLSSPLSPPPYPNPSTNSSTAPLLLIISPSCRRPIQSHLFVSLSVATVQGPMRRLTAAFGHHFAQEVKSLHPPDPKKHIFKKNKIYIYVCMNSRDVCENSPLRR